MNPQALSLLRGACDYFSKLRDLTVDGNGNNLHDIKYTFDYVIQYLEEKKLTDTAIGSELIEKAKASGEIISGLWRELNSLEQSIREFCDKQDIYNNM